MSEPLQFGFHPVADRISAFVEQALPAHEREQVLEHLAVCPECRAVVVLSLPEAEEPVQQLPVSTRKLWWGWTPAWTFGGALAALALLVVYIHHTATVAIAPERQLAVAHSAEPPVSEGQAPVAAAKPAVQGSPASPTRGQVAPPGLAAAAPKRDYEALSAGQAVGGPIRLGRNIVALQQSSEASAAAPAGIPLPAPGSGAESRGGLGSGAGGGIADAPSPAVVSQSLELPPALQAATASSAAQTAKAAAPMRTQTETVMVASAASIETVHADTANLQISQDEVQERQLKHPLPSRLPVLSMAAQASRMVAIDTGHRVFLSKDAGKHWKEIHAPWQGRAVKASIVAWANGTLASSSLSSGVLAGTVPGTNARSTQNRNDALKALSAPPSGSAGFSLTGTVTDMNGAVIAGASITVAGTATGAARAVKTDSAGRYIVDGLAPGTYRVKAQSPGFSQQELAAIVVPSAGQGIANLALPVGSAAQAVTVQTESREVDALEKKPADSSVSSQTVPVFEIVTDQGEHWASTDGLTWKHM